MSSSQYKTVRQTLVKYNLAYLDQDFVDAAPIDPPQLFLDYFDYNLTHFDAFSNESAKSELMILPILREIQRDYVDHSQLWIQESLSVSSELTGTPDYIVAKRSKLGKKVLGEALLIIIEAKQDNFEHGWGQCLAEMVAAQIYNNTTELPMYGIVTNAGVWRFGRLLHSEFWEDTRFFSIDDMPELFGALHFTFRAALSTLAL